MSHFTRRLASMPTKQIKRILADATKQRNLISDKSRMTKQDAREYLDWALCITQCNAALATR
jgi:hypothetical protein